MRAPSSVSGKLCLTLTTFGSGSPRPRGRIAPASPAAPLSSIRFNLLCQAETSFALFLSPDSGISINPGRAGQAALAVLLPVRRNSQINGRSLRLCTSPSINTAAPSGHSGWATNSGVIGRRVLRKTRGGLANRDDPSLSGAVTREIHALGGGFCLPRGSNLPGPGIPHHRPGLPTWLSQGWSSSTGDSLR